jgi:hypothetical protein
VLYEGKVSFMRCFEILGGVRGRRQCWFTMADNGNGIQSVYMFFVFFLVKMIEVSFLFFFINLIILSKDKI